MVKKRIRVLIVDDSPLIREMLCDTLKTQTDLEVVGMAADGCEALQLLETLRPDIVTLDLQMPRMDGLATLEQLMNCRPTPVIVVSSLTQRAADVTLQALESGAMDYIAKPQGMADTRRVFGQELPQKIRNMAGTDVRRVLQFRKSRQLRARAASIPSDGKLAASCAKGCIAIGISTGGPPALSSIFGVLVPPLPPVVVVQHMPPLFTGPFAKRLDALSALTVREGQNGDVLAPNTVYIAPGGKQLSLVKSGDRVSLKIEDGNFVSGHKPSVDVMMRSAAAIFGHHCLGVIMTGMGRDGADGCRAIRAAGGFVLGQDEESSDVYGMNKVAFVEGHVNLQVSLQEMPEAITRCVHRKREPVPVG